MLDNANSRLVFRVGWEEKLNFYVQFSQCPHTNTIHFLLIVNSHFCPFNLLTNRWSIRMETMQSICCFSSGQQCKDCTLCRITDISRAEKRPLSSQRASWNNNKLDVGGRRWEYGPLSIIVCYQREFSKKRIIAKNVVGFTIFNEIAYCEILRMFRLLTHINSTQ